MLSEERGRDCCEEGDRERSGSEKGGKTRCVRVNIRPGETTASARGRWRGQKLGV